MPDAETLIIRPLHRADAGAVRRLLENSDYTYYRFSLEDTARLLDLYPAVGAFTPAAPGPFGRMLSGGALQAFLLVNEMAPPSAWIGGFGVSSMQGQRYPEFLDQLAPPLVEVLRPRGIIGLYYSGADIARDWLKEPLERLGFNLKTMLRAYDKTDFHAPSEGSQSVRVRPFRPSDAEGLVELERLCFDPPWRHDAHAFSEVARMYPYFVVAEDNDGLAGYQFNVVDMRVGYLVRIATHPRVWGQGVGTRLMAEAVHYFEREGVWKIVLNTEETNTRAHQLYEWFGFYLIKPRGFALGLDIEPPAHSVSQAHP